MPIYEYECKNCGKVTEAYQKFSDAPLKKCECCCGKLQKLISHSTFHLKGTGWYVTDYANRSGGAPSCSGEKTKKTSDTKEEKADGKATATKKETTGDSV
jgi:putative FmdB family regulatory protein